MFLLAFVHSVPTILCSAVYNKAITPRDDKVLAYLLTQGYSSMSFSSGTELNTLSQTEMTF